VDESTPCNLVASRDGQIVSILVKDGVRYVKKGQTVQEGDLLVGGIVDTRLGYYVVHAKAEILARITDVVSHTVPLVSEQSVRTGRCKRVFVWTVFGKEFSFPSSSCSYDSYETVREIKYLSFGEDAAVPVVLTEIRYYETVPVSVELTEEQAAEQARVFLNESDRIRLNGVSVESFSERTERVGDSVTVIRTRGLIVDICEEKEFYFEGEGH
jgi:similar to stage IV sporulation protein